MGLKTAIESQCDELCVTSWKDLFPSNFKYPQTAVIRHKVIASTNKFLQLGIILFFVYLFFVEEQYMSEYIPHTRGKFYAYESNYSDWDVRLLNGEEPDYCNNTDYNWIYPFDDYYQYIEATCVHPKFYEMFMGSEKTIFFMTYFAESTLTSMPCANFSYTECVGNYTHYYTSQDSLNETCKCETISNHFTVGVEDIQLEVEHSYNVAVLDAGAKSGEMITVIRDHNGVEVAIPEGDIVFSVGQWMSWAGISLDNFNDQVSGSSMAHPTVSPTATYPYLRITGGKVLLEVKYYNMPKYQEHYHGSAAVAYIDVSAVKQWESRGANVRYIEYPEIVRSDEDLVYTKAMKLVNRYSYGVSFVLTGSGFIGEFDLLAVKTQVVDIICLIGYIPVIMSVCAITLFGFKSQIFAGQLSHGMDGDMKEKEKFRKVFKYLFKSYWTSSYTLDFEQFHKFCCDRDIPIDDEKCIRDECLFMSPKKDGKVVTASLFFLALQDPDPDGTIDRYWDTWAEEYMRMKQELFKKKLARFSASHQTAEGETEAGKHHESGGEEDSEEIANWKHIHKSRKHREGKDDKKHLLKSDGASKRMKIKKGETKSSSKKKTKSKERKSSSKKEKKSKEGATTAGGEEPPAKPEPKVDPQLKAILEKLMLNNLVNEETLKTKNEEIRKLRRNFRETGLKVKALQETSIRKFEDFLERLSSMEEQLDTRSSNFSAMSMSLMTGSAPKTSFVAPRSFFRSPRESTLTRNRAVSSPGDEISLDRDSSSQNGNRTPIMRSRGKSTGRL